jgi:hypothetical protein
MFKASTSWVLHCTDRADKICLRLSTELPPALSKAAKAIHLSTKSWEWKHFWLENALLWQRQQHRTQKLSGEWDAAHDEVFEDWNKSEHAEVFLTMLNGGQSLRAASTHALKGLEEQLLQIYIRHFDGAGTKLKSYRPQFELGEFTTKAQTELIHLGKGRTLEFYSWDKKNFQTHVEHISRSLGLIKTYSPDSFELFCQFTKRIIPIKQKEFVSYSLQSLPGHSFINLYHRDELDLLDDLLHENGHHHLNHYLILGNPLREDPDQIYYSPWRRSLRPIRGIYHAHLTFFFALKLYHDLARALIEERLDWPTSLNPGMKNKILTRYAEEWLMLEYTSIDLKRAIEFGQIKPAGVKLLRMMEIEREKLGTLYPKIKKSVKGLDELRMTLSQQGKLTREI